MGKTFPIQFKRLLRSSNSIGDFAVSGKLSVKPFRKCRPIHNKKLSRNKNGILTSVKVAPDSIIVSVAEM